MNLEDNGFKVYSPGTKIGECFEPYIVVKNNGSSKHINSNIDDDFYTIMCYVPKQRYSKLEPMIQMVKAAMKNLEPMIVPAGSQTPSYYDDGVKAHMISIEYKNYKKVL